MGHSFHSRFSPSKRKRRRLRHERQMSEMQKRRHEANQTPHFGQTVLRKSRQRSHLTHLQNLPHGTTQDDP